MQTNGRRCPIDIDLPRRCLCECDGAGSGRYGLRRRVDMFYKRKQRDVGRCSGRRIGGRLIVGILEGFRRASRSAHHDDAAMFRAGRLDRAIRVEERA